MRGLLLMFLAGLFPSLSLARNPPAAAPRSSMMNFAREPAAGIPGVIAAGTKVQILGSGFKGTEGVAPLPDGSVIFCEFNAGRLVRIDPAGHFATYLEDSNRPIGLGYDRKGHLI